MILVTHSSMLDRFDIPLFPNAKDFSFHRYTRYSTPEEEDENLCSKTALLTDSFSCHSILCSLHKAQYPSIIVPTTSPTPPINIILLPMSPSNASRGNSSLPTLRSALRQTGSHRRKAFTPAAHIRRMACPPRLHNIPAQVRKKPPS